MLALVTRVINHGVDVKTNFRSKFCNAIHVVDVEGIVGRVLAGGLHESSGAQGLAPGEVFLKGDPVPVVHLERNERAIVVAMADAGIDADTARTVVPLPPNAEVLSQDYSACSVGS